MKIFSWLKAFWLRVIADPEIAEAIKAREQFRAVDIHFGAPWND